MNYKEASAASEPCAAGVTEDYLHRPQVVFPNKRPARVSEATNLTQYSCPLRCVPKAASLSISRRLAINPREVPNVRPHQREAVAALVDVAAESFLSGCVVLPCGSGKTLVGVLAAATMRRRTLVVCATLEQVEQWRRQLLQWTLLTAELVYRCGAAVQRDAAELEGAAVVLTTYHWLSSSQEAVGTNACERRAVLAMTYGLLLLDEVHKLPAAVYRHLPHRVSSSWRVGLTADLSREAEEEHVILSSVGPVRARASVCRLVLLRVIARVDVIQVVVPLARGFSCVLQHTPGRPDLHRLLLTLNPYKFCYLRSLIQLVERRKRQKLLVMFEELLHLQVFAMASRRLWACGGDGRRELVVQNFQHSATPQTLLVSRISDTGLDVPDLSYCLQLGSLGGSRQQEVQRVGRVQRYKPDGRGSEFHTVVTAWPSWPELEYSRHRNAHLRQQGYQLRYVQARTVLRPISARQNSLLVKFGHALGRKLSSEPKATVNEWILKVYPPILRALPHQEL
ncbi:uncharacterized protein LOC126985198 [Eriocheir sinensis]|uniref:uncharacterized protein LOC126985198 n=1 Tax=Eriocheir sinensis TaxID=95602 RepID=UPI0021C6001F|nr:uncharacterized protein LOC126985198 [Eriocheir sinensis]